MRRHFGGVRTAFSLAVLVLATDVMTFAPPSHAAEKAAGSFGYTTSTAAPLHIDDPTLAQCYPTNQDGGGRDAMNRTTARAQLFTDDKCQTQLLSVAPKEIAHSLKSRLNSVRFTESTQAVRGTFTYGMVSVLASIQNPIPSLCYAATVQGAHGSYRAYNKTPARAQLFTDEECQTPAQSLAPNEDANNVNPRFGSVSFSP
jgi:hypothetical protein